MEIIIRKKHGNAGEILPDKFCLNDRAVHDEVLRRNAKAGYCTRNGEPTEATKIMSRGIGKERKLNVWPRDSNGNLIGD